MKTKIIVGEMHIMSFKLMTIKITCNLWCFLI